MNGADIVREYLVSHHYDGLIGDCCTCVLDDLMPCCDSAMECEPGYRVEGCTDDCGQACDYHLAREKPGNSQAKE